MSSVITPWEPQSFLDCQHIEHVIDYLGVLYLDLEGIVPGLSFPKYRNVLEP